MPVHKTAPNSQQRLVSVAVTDGVSTWERHDLLLMLLLMLLAAVGWEALGLRFTVAVAVTVRLHFFQLDPTPTPTVRKFPSTCPGGTPIKVIRPYKAL